MTTLLHLFWATMERVLPRVGTALVMLFFARFTSPESVGIYSWVALAYTLYQAVAENALRTMAVLSLRNDGDLAYVRRRAHVSAGVGSGALALALVALGVRYPHQWEVIVGLAPFVVVPFLTTAHILPSAYLQYDQRWGSLARFQLVSACAGLVVSLTTVLVFHSSTAMSLHAVVTETVFCLLTIRAARAVTVQADQPTRSPAWEAPGMVGVSALGWAQGQLERVVMGGVAGPSVLGLYSTAAMMGRSPGDALAAATSNYVRSAVAGSANAGEHARVVRLIGLLSAAVSALGAIALTVVVDRVLAPFLGPSYGPTMDAVPLFAVACIPVSVSVTLQIMAVSSGRSKGALWASVAGLACAPLIGFAATRSVGLAALIVVAKEILVLLVTYVTARPVGAKWPVIVATALTVAGAVILYEVGAIGV